MTSKSTRSMFRNPEADLLDHVPAGYGPNSAKLAMAAIRSAGISTRHRYTPTSFAKSLSSSGGPSMSSAWTRGMSGGMAVANRAPRSVMPARNFTPKGPMGAVAFGMF